MEPFELAERLERGDVVLIDVRRHPGSEQIYGATRYDPRHLLEARRLVLPLPKHGEWPIVLYDQTGEGAELATIAAKFHESGYAPVLRLAGGFAGWKTAARRVEELSLAQPIPGVEDQRLDR